MRIALDIGCGTGKSTRDLARIASDGSVLGVDLSAAMLDQARWESRDEGLDNVTFVPADAEVHEFGEATFGIAISCFGAMFFGNPDAAFTNIRRSLRSGGRMRLLAWSELERNEWVMELRAALAVGRQLPVPPPEAPTPFSLADPDRVGALLSATGFEDVAFEAVDEPIDFGPDADGAYAFVRSLGLVHGLSQDLDDTGRAQALAALQETVAAHGTPEGVLFGTSPLVGPEEPRLQPILTRLSRALLGRCDNLRSSA